MVASTALRRSITRLPLRPLRNLTSRPLEAFNLSAARAISAQSLSTVSKPSATASTPQPAALISGPAQHQRTFATASKPKAHKGRSTTGRKRAGTKAKPKKKAAKKTKPKRKPKRELTPEEKEKAKIRELKKEALRTPSALPATAFLVLCSEMGKQAGALRGKEAGERFRSLSPTEREHYNHLANENKSKNEASFRAWVRTHTPLEIRRANLSRRHLTRLGVKGYRRSIPDDRQVSRPPTAQNLFVKDRFESGDLKGMKVTESLPVVIEEWKELPESRKQEYVRTAEAARTKYVQDMKKVYGKDVKSV